MTVDGSVICRVAALIIFALGAWSPYWGPASGGRAYYPTLISLGLFFWVLSTILK
jgi:hypothetical protein